MSNRKRSGHVLKFKTNTNTFKNKTSLETVCERILKLIEKKMKKTKEIEVLVRNYTDDGKWYVVKYKPKIKCFMIDLNLWSNPWRNIYSVIDFGDSITMDIPMLLPSYEDAMSYAKRIKENPELIEQHNREQYSLLKQKREEKEKRLQEHRKITIL